jgi:hypothetical protein
MTAVIIWILLGWAFLKCVEMVIRPFARREERYEESPPSVHVHIQDSFNYHSSDSYYKGGTTYHGVSEKEKGSNEYFELYKKSIENNQYYTRGDRN